MAASKIEWCDRSDWNPIRGCTRVSPGCGGPGPHGGCYAEAIAARFSDPGQPFHGFAERTKNGPRWTGKVELQEDRLTLPLRWRKPVRIFVSSTSDVFHEALPDEAIDKIFAVMALAPQYTFQVLTKRAERMRGYLAQMTRQEWWKARIRDSGVPGAFDWPCPRYPDWPLPNVWLGVSIEDQPRADERIPLLLETPAAEHFISAEPLLGPLDIRGWLGPRAIKGPDCYWLDWIIVGGESGPNARPMHLAWARSLRDQCAAAGVPFFFKQHGEFIDADEWYGMVTRHGPIKKKGDDGAWHPWVKPPLNFADAAELAGMTGYDGRAEHQSDGSTLIRVGKKAAGRLLDGVLHNGFPDG